MPRVVHGGDGWGQTFHLGCISLHGQLYILKFNLVYSVSFATTVKWQHASCTTELGAYETASTTNTPVSNYWRTTVSYLCVSLHCGSVTPLRRSTCCDRSQPGSRHWISQLQGVLRVNSLLRAIPHSPSLAPPWIDDAWPDSTESQSSTQRGSTKQERILF